MKKKIIGIFICIIVIICSAFTVVASICVEKQRLVIRSNSDNQGGNTLITEMVGNRVIEVNSSGFIVWQKTDLNTPIDAERLENGNTLITEYASGLIIEVDTGGNTVWEHDTGSFGPYDAERLSNGNTLITNFNLNHVIEVNSDGTIVWSKTGLNFPADAERLENGNTLITEIGNARVIECDINGTIVWEYNSSTAMDDAERLGNGNTLITESSGYVNRVIEVNSNGDIVWEYNNSSTAFFDAERLSNGNTLITDWGSNRVIEVDSNGTIVWQKTGLNVPNDAERIYISNEPPNIPTTPSGPTWLNLNAEGTYNTSASDPDDDWVQYRFDWDANGSHDYSNWTDLVPSGTQANLSHSWDTGGTYVVKAQARDEHYEPSGWSNGLSVFVNCPPNIPNDPEPEDGATEVDIEADLSWSCSDPDGDNLTYDVYFEADDPTPDELVSNNQSESWYDPGTMEYGTHYYWQIVAWDEYGLSTEGSVWDFTTGSEPNDPPNHPSNPSPEDGATEVDIEVDLNWDCDDPDGDSLTYDVYFDTVNPPVDKVSDDQAESIFDPGTLEFGTTFYWRIIAKDEHGASTASLVWHFTTEENNPPSAITITGETNGKAGVEYTYFIINATDPDEDDIWANFSWGDGSYSGWIGPNTSGEDICASHAWERGNYAIKAKLKDEWGLESYWSDPFPITMPKNKHFIFNFPLLNWLFERFLNAFPVLWHILGF